MNLLQIDRKRDSANSGLDAQSAFNIVRFLRKLCDAGQAILCTIHQPSAILFEHFDDLLLLQSGGKTVYFGPLGNDCQTLIEYLERNGAPKCRKNSNPAEYLPLVVSGLSKVYVGCHWRRSNSEDIAGLV